MPAEASGHTTVHSQQAMQIVQPQKDQSGRNVSMQDAQPEGTRMLAATVVAAHEKRSETEAGKEVTSAHYHSSAAIPYDPAASRTGIDAGVCSATKSSEGCNTTSQRVELKAEDLQVIRTFLRKICAQQEQRGQLKQQEQQGQVINGQHTSTTSGNISGGETVSAGQAAELPARPSSEEAETARLEDEAYLEDTLQRLQCAHVAVPEILKGHPKSLGMLIKSLQVMLPDEKVSGTLFQKDIRPCRQSTAEMKDTNVLARRPAKTTVQAKLEGC